MLWGTVAFPRVDRRDRWCISGEWLNVEIAAPAPLFAGAVASEAPFKIIIHSRLIRSRSKPLCRATRGSYIFHST